MLYGIYNAYWTHEWSANYEHYIPKVKKLHPIVFIGVSALVGILLKMG